MKKFQSILLPLFLLQVDGRDQRNSQYVDNRGAKKPHSCDQGPRGPTGAEGVEGDQGTRGDRGIQGLQGVQGLVGNNGSTGETGDPGPKGPPGDDAKVGPRCLTLSSGGGMPGRGERGFRIFGQGYQVAPTDCGNGIATKTKSTPCGDDPCFWTEATVPIRAEATLTSVSYFKTNTAGRGAKQTCELLVNCAESYAKETLDAFPNYSSIDVKDHNITLAPGSRIAIKCTPDSDKDSWDWAGGVICYTSEEPVIPAPACRDQSQWPDWDGVACADCWSLVQTRTHRNCADYCSSFGHVCHGAADEDKESCNVKEVYECKEDITDTSDILCQCKFPDV